MRLYEFSTSGDDDDGFSDETLKQLAAQWYNGDEDPRIERTLAAAGWEIGQDEGYDDEPGVFVVMAGDVNGNSYMSWPADELRQFDEGIIDTVKKVFTPTNPVKDMRDKVQSGQVKDAGASSVFQMMSDRNKEMQQGIDAATKENFADGRHPEDKGDAKRHGVPTKASISTLRDVAKHSSGRKAQLAHWMANMKAGHKK